MAEEGQAAEEAARKAMEEEAARKAAEAARQAAEEAAKEEALLNSVVEAKDDIVAGRWENGSKEEMLPGP